MRQDLRWASNRNTRQQGLVPSCKHMHAWQSLGRLTGPQSLWTHTGGSDSGGGRNHRRGRPTGRQHRIPWGPKPAPGAHPSEKFRTKLLHLSSQKRIAGLYAVNFVNKLLHKIRAYNIDIIIGKHDLERDYQNSSRSLESSRIITKLQSKYSQAYKEKLDSN